MELERKINALNALGDHLKRNLKTERFKAKLAEAHYYNRWFPPENSKKAIQAIIDHFLDETKLRKWVSSYELPVQNLFKVGIVMAGNIPLVGFHDLLSVLISGHYPVVKMSSKDEILLPFIIGELAHIEPELAHKVSFVDRLLDFDAVIATGSNNTSRYFEYYFGHYPNIIRKNRTSVAILTGNESQKELEDLADAIFQYFGLGCRNVSKIYVPYEYDFHPLFDALNTYQHIHDYQQYQNNYLYNKGLLVMNGENYMDTGFLMMQNRDQLVSPMAMIHFEYYDPNQPEALKAEIREKAEDIQVVAGNEPVIEEVEVSLDQVQQPELWNYPDHIDILQFLEGLETKEKAG